MINPAHNRTPNTNAGEVRRVQASPTHPVENQAGIFMQAGFWILCLIICWSPLGFVMQLGFPVVAFLAGIFFFRRSKSEYVSFVCWNWVLAAFIAPSH